MLDIGSLEGRRAWLGVTAFIKTTGMRQAA